MRCGIACQFLHSVHPSWPTTWSGHDAHTASCTFSAHWGITFWRHLGVAFSVCFRKIWKVLLASASLSIYMHSNVEQEIRTERILLWLGVKRVERWAAEKRRQGWEKRQTRASQISEDKKADRLEINGNRDMKERERGLFPWRKELHSEVEETADVSAWRTFPLFQK